MEGLEIKTLTLREAHRGLWQVTSVGLLHGAFVHLKDESRSRGASHDASGGLMKDGVICINMYNIVTCVPS